MRSLPAKRPHFIIFNVDVANGLSRGTRQPGTRRQALALPMACPDAHVARTDSKMCTRKNIAEHFWQVTSNSSLVDMLAKEWCFVRRAAGSWALLGDASGPSRSSQENLRVCAFWCRRGRLDVPGGGPGDGGKGLSGCQVRLGVTF